MLLTAQPLVVAVCAPLCEDTQLTHAVEGQQDSSGFA